MKQSEVFGRRLARCFSHSEFSYKRVYFAKQCYLTCNFLFCQHRFIILCAALWSVLEQLLEFHRDVVLDELGVTVVFSQT